MELGAARVEFVDDAPRLRARGLLGRSGDRDHLDGARGQRPRPSEPAPLERLERDLVDALLFGQRDLEVDAGERHGHAACREARTGGRRSAAQGHQRRRLRVDHLLVPRPPEPELELELSFPRLDGQERIDMEAEDVTGTTHGRVGGASAPGVAALRRHRQPQRLAGGRLDRESIAAVVEGVLHGGGEDVGHRQVERGRFAARGSGADLHEQPRPLPVADGELDAVVRDRMRLLDGDAARCVAGKRGGPRLGAERPPVDGQRRHRTGRPTCRHDRDRALPGLGRAAAPANPNVHWPRGLRVRRRGRREQHGEAGQERGDQLRDVDAEHDGHRERRGPVGRQGGRMVATATDGGQAGFGPRKWRLRAIGPTRYTPCRAASERGRAQAAAASLAAAWAIAASSAATSGQRSATSQASK